MKYAITLVLVIISLGCLIEDLDDIPIGDDKNRVTADDINNLVVETYGFQNTNYGFTMINDSLLDGTISELAYYNETVEYTPSGKIYTFARDRSISRNWCDSDDGYNIYEKGGASKYYDSCIDSTHLSELLCMDDYDVWVSYNQYCAEGCSDGQCIKPPISAYKTMCKPFIEGQNNVNDQNRVNIVVVGFNYNNRNDFIERVNRSISWNREARGIFALEPFRSNKEKFNVWYVDNVFSIELGELQQSESYGVTITPEQRDKILYYDNEISKVCGLTNVITIGLLNEYGISYANLPDSQLEKYTGQLANAVVLYPDNEIAQRVSKCKDKETCEWYEDFYLNKGSPAAASHEFGHAFASLSDEYELGLSEVNSTTPYSNCILNESTTTVKQCLEKASWKDLIGMGCGKPDQVDCTQDDSNYELEVNCYEGCAYRPEGTFRPTFASLMSTSTNRTWFNDENNYRIYGPVNERIICCRMLYYTGQAGGACIDYNSNGFDLLDFCSKYKDANSLD